MGVFLLMQPTLLFTIICHALCATLKSSSSCFHLVPLFKRHPMFTPITESSLQPPILILKVFVPHFCYKNKLHFYFFALTKATTFIFTLTLLLRGSIAHPSARLFPISRFKCFTRFKKIRKKHPIILYIKIVEFEERNVFFFCEGPLIPLIGGKIAGNEIFWRRLQL